MMLLEQETFREKLARINATYFSDPARRLTFQKGNAIIYQGEENHRLYLILSGDVVGYRHFIKEDPESGTSSHNIFEVFRAGPGSYVGVQSFFSQWFKSSSDIIATSDVEIAYIDDTTPASEPEKYGSLLEQFMPTIVHELSQRNSRVYERTWEKEEALRLLHRSEMAATLGQLSAGIAHELNNAIGVLARKTEFVAEAIAEILHEGKPEREQLFLMGRDSTTVQSSEDIRKLTREFEREFELDQNSAKILSHIANSTDEVRNLGSKFLKNFVKNSRYWELGHDIHDMRLAAKHSAGIVRSVKLLGGGNNINRELGHYLPESISEAISLIKSNIREINLEVDIPENEEFPEFVADMTELVQIWVNIIKNACDAMKHAGTISPTIHISCKMITESLGADTSPQPLFCVQISDNGPGIPDSLHQKIFQPNFTTKKKGLSFGLGLGLAIVKRIIDNYDGIIQLHSQPGDTLFTIKLPVKK